MQAAGSKCHPLAVERQPSRDRQSYDRSLKGSILDVHSLGLNRRAERPMTSVDVSLRFILRNAAVRCVADPPLTQIAVSQLHCAIPTDTLVDATVRDGMGWDGDVTSRVVSAAAARHCRHRAAERHHRAAVAAATAVRYIMRRSCGAVRCVRRPRMACFYAGDGSRRVACDR